MLVVLIDSKWFLVGLPSSPFVLPDSSENILGLTRSRRIGVLSSEVVLPYSALRRIRGLTGRFKEHGVRFSVRIGQAHYPCHETLHPAGFLTIYGALAT